MSIAKMEILKLYRALLKESSKFSNYNFRMYALRRIKSRFRENQFLTDSAEIESWYKDGQKNLDIIKRQVVINDLYKAEKLVIENER
ncbi:protein bcn92 [Planococcus citri]|uniref:protein bcn92 n=1 Tax=Planococcus citri TaxID=170843 RepID=UPI0031FA439B